MHQPTKLLVWIVQQLLVQLRKPSSMGPTSIFRGKPAIVALLRLYMPFNINDTHEELIKWYVISVTYCILFG